jgi:hypothetical protein
MSKRRIETNGLPEKMEAVEIPRESTNAPFIITDPGELTPLIKKTYVNGTYYNIPNESRSYYDLQGRIKTYTPLELAEDIKNDPNPEERIKFLLQSKQIERHPDGSNPTPLVMQYRPGAIRGKEDETFNDMFEKNKSVFVGVDKDKLFELNDIPKDLSEEEKKKAIMSKKMISVPVGSYYDVDISNNPEAQKYSDILQELFETRYNTSFQFPKPYLDYFASELVDIAGKRGVDQDRLNQVLSVMLHESKLIPNAQSYSGARGLAQVVANTKDDAGFEKERDALTVRSAIEGAFNVFDKKEEYLRNLIKLPPSFDNLLRAYNAGQTNEARYVFGIPYEQLVDKKKAEEVMGYPGKVRTFYDFLNKKTSGTQNEKISDKFKLALGGELTSPLFEEVDQLKSGDFYLSSQYDSEDISDFDFGDEDYYADPNNAVPVTMQKGLEYLAYEHEKRNTGQRPPVEDDKEKSRLQQNLYALQQAPKLVGKGLFQDFVASALKGGSEFVSWVSKKTEGLFAPSRQLDEDFIKVGEGKWKRKNAQGAFANVTYDRDALRKMGYQIAADAEDMAAYRIGSGVESLADEIFYVPEELEQTTTGQVARGVGQAIGYIGSAPGALMRGGIKGFVNTTTKGAFVTLGFEAQQLKDKKDAATTMTADEFTSQGYGDYRTYQYLRENEYDDIVGRLMPGVLAAASVESIGYGALFNRMSKFSPKIAGRIKSGLGKYVDDVINANPKSKQIGSILMAGFTGAAEEVVQDAILNLSASEVYDFTRSVTSGLTDSAIVGGSTTAIMQILLNGIAKRANIATDKHEVQQLDKAKKELEEKLKLQDAKDQAVVATAKGETIPADAAAIITRDRDEKAKKAQVNEAVSVAREQVKAKRMERVQKVAQTLSEALGTQVNVFDGDADGMIIDPVSGKRAKGVVDEDGTIRIDAAVADEKTALHEFGHIFLDRIKIDNPELYANLIQQAKKKMPELVAQLEADYKGKADNETATRILEMYAAGELDKRSTLYKIADQLWNYVRDLLGQGINRSIVDGKIDFSRLGPNTTLGDIGKLLGDVAYQRKQVTGFTVRAGLDNTGKKVRLSPDLQEQASDALEVVNRKGLQLDNVVEENNEVTFGFPVDTQAEAVSEPASEDIDAAKIFIDFLKARASDPAVPEGATIPLPESAEQAKIELDIINEDKQYQLISDDFFETDEYKAAFQYFQSAEYKAKVANMSLEDQLYLVMKALGIQRSQAIKAFEAATGKKYTVDRDPSQKVISGELSRVKGMNGLFMYLAFQGADVDLGFEQYAKAMDENSADSRVAAELFIEARAKKKTEVGKFQKIYQDVMSQLFGDIDGKIGKRKANAKSFVGKFLQAKGLAWDDLNTFAAAMHSPERNERIALMKIDEATEKNLLADELEANGKVARAQKLREQAKELLAQVSAVRSGKRAFAMMTTQKAEAVLDEYRRLGKYDDLQDAMDEFRRIIETPFFQVLSDNQLMEQDRIDMLMKGSREGYPDFEHYVPMIIDGDKILEDEGLDPVTNGLEAEYAGANIEKLKGTTTKATEDRYNPLDIMLTRLFGASKKAMRNETLRTLAEAIELGNSDYQASREAADLEIEDVLLDPASQIPILPRSEMDDAAIETARENMTAPRAKVVEAKLTPQTVNGKTVFVDTTPDSVKANSVEFIDKDGKKKYIQFRDGDDMLLTALKVSPLQGGSSDTWPTIQRIVRPINSFLRAAYTYGNPAFSIASTFRDRLDMQLMAAGYDFKSDPKKVRKQMRKNYRAAMKHMTIGGVMKNPGSETAKYWLEAQKAGMPMSWAVKVDNKSVIEDINNKLSALEGKEGLKKNLSRVMEDALAPMVEFSNRMENTVRLAAYMTARQNGLSVERAAAIGKDITVNFEQRGASKSLQKLGSLYLFFGPAVQGIYKTSKIVGQVGKDIKERKASETSKQLIKVALISGAMRELFHYFSDDEEKKQYVINDWVSSAYSFIPTGTDIPIKIPKPYSINRLVMNMTEGLVDVRHGYKTMNDVALNTIRDAMILYDPIAGGSPHPINYAPPFIAPLLQAAFNINWLGDKIVKRQTAGIPNYLQPNYSTREWANNLAEFLYSYSGGVADINPSLLEYVIQAYATPGILGDIAELGFMAYDDGLDKAASKILEKIAYGRFYSDFTEEQKSYLYNFFDLNEKPAIRGITQKELEYYFEAGKILMKTGKLSEDLFEEGYMNILRRFPDVSVSDIKKAAKVGIKNADVSWKRFGYTVPIEEIKEKTMRRLQQQQRLDEQIKQKID